jgi:hypothetical protein
LALIQKGTGFCLKNAISGINAIASVATTKTARGFCYFSTDIKTAPFLGRFGRKIDVSGNKNDICFCVFAIFECFLHCKSLQISN